MPKYTMKATLVASRRMRDVPRYAGRMSPSLLGRNRHAPRAGRRRRG